MVYFPRAVRERVAAPLASSVGARQDCLAFEEGRGVSLVYLAQRIKHELPKPSEGLGAVRYAVWAQLSQLHEEAGADARLSWQRVNVAVVVS